MTAFEIRDSGEYSTEYPRLAEALGVHGASPAQDEVEFLTDLTRPNRYAFGMLPPPDTFFAAACTSILNPPVAIEIGTASGFSAAVLAKIMALRREQDGSRLDGILVHTIDYKAQAPDDPTKPVGFGIALIAPELLPHIAVHPLKESSRCHELVPPGELAFAFVDGNHRHPWPLLDVLRVQQVIRDGWILLHDIDLPGLTERARAAGEQIAHFPGAGAQHVFDFWPGEKVSGGNIGAIKTPKRQPSLRGFVEKLRGLPAEVSPASWSKRWRDIDELLQAF